MSGRVEVVTPQLNFYIPKMKKAARNGQLW